MLDLNVGSGDFPAPQPWLNVDVNPIRNPDVLAELDDLPFADGEAARIYAGHVLEHIPVLEVVGVLREFRRVLSPSGSLMVVGPDVVKAFPMFCDGKILTADYRDMLYSNSEHTLMDGHAWPCVEPMVDQMMRAAGFTTRSLDVRDLQHSEWPVVSFVEFQFAIEGMVSL
jgi:predicted SAM-dependent methyltransferase